MNKASFDSWAIVELMGHARIAGRVSEAEVGGGKLLRVDVPEDDGNQALTKFLGTSAIYAITPVDEETARLAVRECAAVPVNEWSARRLLEIKDAAAKPQLQAVNDDQDDDDDLGF